MSNWDIGTLLIIVFAIVCVGLIALVLSFVMAGKPKTDDKFDQSADNKNSKL